MKLIESAGSVFVITILHSRGFLVMEYRLKQGGISRVINTTQVKVDEVLASIEIVNERYLSAILSIDLSSLGITRSSHDWEGIVKSYFDGDYVKYPISGESFKMLLAESEVAQSIFKLLNT